MMTRLHSIILALTLSTILEAHPLERNALIHNGSPSKMSVYWLDTESQESSFIFALQPGEELDINTFVGHEFQVLGSDCQERETCPNSSGFVITRDKVQQEFLIERDYSISYIDPMSIKSQQDFVVVDQPSPSIDFKDSRYEPQPTPRSSCRQQAQGSLLGLYSHDGSAPSSSVALRALDGFTSCLAENVTHTLQQINHDLSLEEIEIRRNMAAQLENYTCADANLPTTAPLYTIPWTHELTNVTFSVGIVHERQHSKIHVLENFISREECAAIEEAGKATLHKATVADGKGGSQYSPNRKAMQAGIKVPWEKEAEGDLIAAVSRRVLDYANHVLGLNLKEPGQEDLMSIQYFGRGLEDPSPDQYTPHCDGDCTGLKHKIGGRVATMVMYCTVPERGGSTNFRNAGVHVAPKQGAAAFFASIGPDDLIMDNGYTEHSGCPVLLGEKKIAVQWLRLGVDQENSWDSFNTRKSRKVLELGLKILFYSLT